MTLDTQRPYLKFIVGANIRAASAGSIWFVMVLFCTTETAFNTSPTFDSGANVGE